MTPYFPLQCTAPDWTCIPYVAHIYWLLFFSLYWITLFEVILYFKWDLQAQGRLGLCIVHISYPCGMCLATWSSNFKRYICVRVCDGSGCKILVVFVFIFLFFFFWGLSISNCTQLQLTGLCAPHHDESLGVQLKLCTKHLHILIGHHLLALRMASTYHCVPSVFNFPRTFVLLFLRVTLLYSIIQQCRSGDLVNDYTKLE